MPRRPRTILPGYPYHLIVRGNARQAIFHDDDDRRTLLRCLGVAAPEAQFMIHAYVLMSNHLHLVGTPASADSLARTMQGIGRSYVRAFNRRHDRSGTLWEGRYRASLIDSDRYLLACMRYVESNPVRAGMVSAARDWRWSSHRHNIGESFDGMVSAHSVYWGLGNTPFERERAYKSLFDAVARERAAPVDDGGEARIDAVMQAMVRGHPAADDEWIDALEARHGLMLRPGMRGRPARKAPPVPAAVDRRAAKTRR